MPIPYRYFASPDLPKFDLDEKVTTEAQLAMPWGDETAHTTLTYLGLAEGERFERYSVEHQVDQDVDAIFEQRAIKRIIVVRRFLAFYLRLKGYFVVVANKRDARGAFERLERAKSPIIAKPADLDLLKVQELGKTTGGWFGKLKIADVQTAAVFGTETVAASEEWARYSDAGELSAVYMTVRDEDGTTRKVMFGRDRLVMLMKGSGEGADLELVEHLEESIDAVLGA